MSWIESHQTLPNHPKLARLASALKIHKGMAFWHLHRLWYWALDYAADGATKGLSEVEIADAAGWEGDAKTFFAAIHATGWIDKNGYIHDWHDYAGKLLESRAWNARRMREKRQQERAVHVRRTCGARAPSECDARAGLPYRTVPNPTVPTKEGGLARPPLSTPPALGAAHQVLVAHFCEGWKSKYGEAFPFATSGGKNGAQIKSILAGTGGNLTAATAAVDRFFADDDPWVVKNHHPLGALVNGLVKYLTPGPIEECGGKTEAEIVALIRDNPLDPEVEAACAEHEADTKRGKAEALERRAREKAAKLAKEAS